MKSVALENVPHYLASAGLLTVQSPLSKELQSPLLPNNNNK